MTAFDAEILRSDPATIALGPAAEAAHEEAVRSPRKEAPACQAAVASYRVALMFRVLFTTLAFALALAATVALVFAVANVFKEDGLALSSAVTGVGGIMASGGAVFVTRRMRQATSVAREALADVGTYCGSHVKEEVEAA